MKTPLSSVDSGRASRSSSPRLLCRVVRRVQAGREAVASERGRGWSGRHAADCEDCGRFFAAAAELERQLRAEAAATAATGMTGIGDVPAGLEERIWAAVRPEVVARREAARGWSWAAGLRSVGAMTALAGIAVVAVGVVWLRQDSQSALREENGNGNGSANVAVASISGKELNADDLRELAGSIRSFSASWLQPVGAVAESVQAGPLEEEWQALGQDTASAWRFLEKNFLPSNAREVAASETKA